MNRRAAALVVPLALLSACGGGGGKGSSLPPVNNTPQKKTGTATFSFKIPGKSTMARVRRPYYQSQATEGVAIDWLSTTPNAPDYSAAIAATCPATLPAGVVACTVVNGNTDYMFQLQIPAGTYPNLTVTTYDTPPSGGTFTGNMLAQGQLAAPVVIVAGQANTIPGLTFYGVPASVSFQPGPAQSHVVMFNGNLSVIGNNAQTFFAQALDADGFVIDSTDGTGPTVTVTEAVGDTPQEFTIATTAVPYQYTLAAKNAVANATIDVTATPGGTGLPPIVDAVVVTPIQELWTTVEAGSAPTGIYGYPLYGTSQAVQPIDGYNDPVGNALCGGGSSCNFQFAASDPSSNSIYAIGTNNSGFLQVFAFTPTAAPPGLTPPGSAVWTEDGGANIKAMGIDAHQHGFLLNDDSSLGYVQLEQYSTTNWGSGGLDSLDLTLTTYGAQAIAVAPSATNVPSALVGSLWVGTNAGEFLVYPPSTLLQNAPATASGTLSGVAAMGFDASGLLWLTDGSNVYIARISGTPAAASITILAQTSVASQGAVGTSFAAGAGNTVYLGEGTGEYTGFDQYVASGCPSSCSITVNAQVLPTNAASFAAITVEP